MYAYVCAWINVCEREEAGSLFCFRQPRLLGGPVISCPPQNGQWRPSIDRPLWFCPPEGGRYSHAGTGGPPTFFFLVSGFSICLVPFLLELRVLFKIKYSQPAPQKRNSLPFPQTTTKMEDKKDWALSPLRTKRSTDFGRSYGYVGVEIEGCAFEVFFSLWCLGNGGS